MSIIENLINEYKQTIENNKKVSLYHKKQLENFIKDIEENELKFLNGVFEENEQHFLTVVFDNIKAEGSFNFEYTQYSSILYINEKEYKLKIIPHFNPTNGCIVYLNEFHFTLNDNTIKDIKGFINIIHNDLIILLKKII
jgi:hypothetical protein